MNYLNPWDYYNPTGDGFIRVDDLLGVIEHFSPEGDPPYDVLYDKGPPDGVIDLPNDILGMILRYHDDCSTPPVPGPTPPASAGLAFSIGVDTDGDTTDDCDTSGGSTACTLPDISFTVNLYLDSLPTGVSDYVALQTRLDYSGAGFPTSDTYLQDWVDCHGATMFVNEFPGQLDMACLTYLLPPAFDSFYTGQIGSVDFDCITDGQISLVHGEIDTALFEDAATFHIEGNASTETLSITCDGPTPT
ncbi:MAG: flexitail domain-containing putative surface protein, partial [Anaerolineae bacterium]